MSNFDFWSVNANVLVVTFLALIAFFLFWGVMYRRP